VGEVMAAMRAASRKRGLPATRAMREGWPMAASKDDGQLPRAWTNVVLASENDETFLLRPRQLLAAPQDADVAQANLPPGWERKDESASAVLFELPGGTGTAQEVLDALAKVRAATGGRAHVAPNHVLVGEQDPPVTFTGEPRIQGGNATCAIPVAPPAALPQRTTHPGDGKGVALAVLDTGLFQNPLLTPKRVDGAFDDTWDLDRDGFADAEAGHGTFVSGLILQVAPSAHVMVVKVLDSHGVGDDYTVAKVMERLPESVDIVNLSLGGYTEKNAPPLATAAALARIHARGGAVVAAAGNAGKPRPFWPAASPTVVGVGAVDRGETWTRPQWSNYGPWVDAVTRGSNVASTFGHGKTRVVETVGGRVRGEVFQYWARWDGTSFSTPVVAGYLARLMTRQRLRPAEQAVTYLRQKSPPSPDRRSFPAAVLVDDVEPGVTLP
jgi:Subtilase family